MNCRTDIFVEYILYYEQSCCRPHSSLVTLRNDPIKHTDPEAIGPTCGRSSRAASARVSQQPFPNFRFRSVPLDLTGVLLPWGRAPGSWVASGRAFWNRNRGCPCWTPPAFLSAGPCPERGLLCLGLRPRP